MEKNKIKIIFTSFHLFIFIQNTESQKRLSVLYEGNFQSSLTPAVAQVPSAGRTRAGVRNQRTSGITSVVAVTCWLYAQARKELKIPLCLAVHSVYVSRLNNSAHTCLLLGPLSGHSMLKLKDQFNLRVETFIGKQ